ncbi:Clavaminate synthase-like protein [Neoconidiobolus thromboides FSU 785]|nr:Clavaminate synthase-like protein [Neoconidiobolus thromboides FSU 785]
MLLKQLHLTRFNSFYQLIRNYTTYKHDNINKIISLTLPNAAVKQLDYYWLRDNCTCPQCIDPSSTQKLHSSGEINLDLKLKDMKVEQNQLKLLWEKNSLINEVEEELKKGKLEEGHKTVYDLKDLTGEMEPLLSVPIKIWDDTIHLENITFDYQHYLKDPKLPLLNLYKYGIVLLNNVESGENIVNKIGEKIGPIMSTFYGTNWHVKSVTKPNNIAYTGLKLNFHMDLLYFESPPGIQLLNCLENEATGGNSLFLDGLKILSDLKHQFPEYYNILQQTLVTYKYNNDGHHMIFKRPIIEENHNFNSSPNFNYAPPFMGKLDLVNINQCQLFYKAMSKLDELISQNQILLNFKLNKNTCVLFNNRRLLHAREKFETSGNRHFNGTYVGLDPFLDTIRKLIK